MAKESPIKRPVVRLPEGGQLGLFGSKELQGSERHAERSGKVIFNQGSVEDLFIGSVRVEEHLRVTGEREAFVVREVLSEMDFRELESGYRPGGRRPYSPRSMLGLVLYGVMQGGDIAAGVGAPGAGESGMHVGERGDNPGPFGDRTISDSARVAVERVAGERVDPRGVGSHGLGDAHGRWGRDGDTGGGQCVSPTEA